MYHTVAWRLTCRLCYIRYIHTRNPTLIPYFVSAHDNIAETGYNTRDASRGLLSWPKIWKGKRAHTTSYMRRTTFWIVAEKPHHLDGTCNSVNANVFRIQDRSTPRTVCFSRGLLGSSRCLRGTVRSPGRIIGNWLTHAASTHHLHRRFDTPTSCEYQAGTFLTHIESFVGGVLRRCSVRYGTARSTRSYKQATGCSRLLWCGKRWFDTLVYIERLCKLIRAGPFRMVWHT